MLHEAGYNIIELFSAMKGMNQNIAPEVLPVGFSYYIENIYPNSIGEAQVRFGTSTNFDAVDTIIEAFPFQLADGDKQEILYLNTYLVPNPVTNLRVTSANNVFLSCPQASSFQPDTYVAIQYRSNNGTSPLTYFLIQDITYDADTDANSIQFDLEDNTFPDDLTDFYIQQLNVTITYVANNKITITQSIPFDYTLFYEDGQSIQLVINAITYNLTIAVHGINHTVPGQITFTFNETIIPPFTGTDTVTLFYASSTPEIIAIYYSVGTIKIRDKITNQFLTGGTQSLTNLSVACVPRGEFFANKYWICNGVDPIMTWDGTVLQVYQEYVKEQAQSFNSIDATHFSFTTTDAFIIGKYANNNSIQLKINSAITTTTVTNIAEVGNVVTITTSSNIPAFTGQDRVELFYSDYPPAFSFLKAAHDRLWALGIGAVSLDYRTPNEALRVYYSYLPFSETAPFRFFNETTKSVPSINISAKHGGSDNLEAIVNVNGFLAFIGRQKTQVWSGIDPINLQAANAFTWSSTIPVGIYHGNLVVELANDAYFVNQNGFLSFSTLNIAKQFSASSTGAMDRILRVYIDSINTNFDYRACRAFKYKYGSFCGFKVGQNNVIASMYHTQLWWWYVLSGSFARATTFMTTLDEALYLYEGNKVYQYADGIIGEHIYGDYDGTSSISFNETKIIKNKVRWANKRYEIQADYSSSFTSNPENFMSVYIKGYLRESFLKQDFTHLPNRGDVLGTINLVEGDVNNPNFPDPRDVGLRLDSPYQNRKGRLKFLSSNFWVSVVGKTKNGPINFKKIRLFGILER